ncbi:hypothetical protein PSN45_001894 [Yamadazyma tenuis]|uniref:uncharacterized protein n=1 Tax=Candida tenuis TaxID=2315449 RepID=UPI0027A6CFCB|nr:hypothetical protein PSN45_001894 [Yamadazyma tenuis]
MKLNIRLSTENSFTVSTASTVYADLVQEIQSCSSFPLPQTFKLIYNGEKLSDTRLADLQAAASEGVAGDAEINVILMEESKKLVKKKKSKKCSFQSCNSSPLRMVGDCHHCTGKFCAKHRLLEDHMCSGLQCYKEIAHEQNALKLENERTISSKV